MIQTGHGEAKVEDITYRARHPRLPVETFELDELRQETVLDRRPIERLRFHVLILCTGGSGHHLVDFTDVPLVPGRILHLRPGQVHRWQVGSAYQARLVLFPDYRRLSSLKTAWFPGDLSHTSLDPSPEALHAIFRTLDELVFEQLTFDASDGAIATMDALVDVLLSRISRVTASGSVPTQTNHIYIAFREAIEESLGRHLEVANIARQLGYSTRTLDRVCHAAVGQAAKPVLDARLLLEAQRLLAHTDDSIQRVSHLLGFSEATNFTKFVKRLLGQTPSQFRAHSKSTSREEDDRPYDERFSARGVPDPSSVARTGRDAGSRR